MSNFATQLNSVANVIIIDIDCLMSILLYSENYYDTTTNYSAFPINMAKTEFLMAYMSACPLI